MDSTLPTQACLSPSVIILRTAASCRLADALSIVCAATAPSSTLSAPPVRNSLLRRPCVDCNWVCSGAAIRFRVSRSCGAPRCSTTRALIPRARNASDTRDCVRLNVPVPSKTSRATVFAPPSCSTMPSMPATKPGSSMMDDSVGDPGACMALLRSTPSTTSPSG